ncbi:hypothetical protein BGX26_007636 [Mortierella sp. AD094]|nr:hypothetical protein BGX26_007636 [Mortierella sp. AD094]
MSLPSISYRNDLLTGYSIKDVKRLPEGFGVDPDDAEYVFDEDVDDGDGVGIDGDDPEEVS